MPTIKREVIIANKLGLHARPAFHFVDTASRFTSEIRVHKAGDDPVDADGKSVMQMITLEATEGTPLTIEANGDDAEAAIAALAELVSGKFGED